MEQDRKILENLKRIPKKHERIKQNMIDVSCGITEAQNFEVGVSKNDKKISVSEPQV